MKLKALFVGAAIVFAFATLIHIPAVFGVGLIEPNGSLFFLMHVVCLALMASYVFIIKKTNGAEKLNYNALLADLSMPVKIAVLIGFAYSIFNFAWFLLNMPYTPVARQTGYFLLDHGKTIRAITKEEYKLAQAAIVRGFSGHWLLFSGFVLASAYGRAQKSNTKLF